MKAKYQSGTSFCIEISDSTSRTCMTVADAVRLKEELTKAIDDAEKDKREELTEFEKACMELYNEGRDDGFSGYKLSNEAVKESASELLSLAKQQLLLSGELLTQEHHEKLMETLCEECKKDLPRWKTIKKNDNAIVRIPHVSTNMLGGKMLYIGENAISISCLMKLPGFKEDESHE